MAYLVQNAQCGPDGSYIDRVGSLTLFSSGEVSSITYPSILAQLFSLAYTYTVSFATWKMSSWTQETQQIDVQAQYAAPGSFTSPTTNTVGFFYSPPGISSAGDATPALVESAGSTYFPTYTVDTFTLFGPTPLTSTAGDGVSGYWSSVTASHPCLVVTYDVVTFDTSMSPSSSGPLLIRFFLLGSAGACDIGSIGCSTPDWWQSAQLDSDPTARSFFHDQTLFWLEQNNPSSTVISCQYIEDRLSSPSGWARRTLELTYPGRDSMGAVLTDRLYYGQLRTPDSRPDSGLVQPIIASDGDFPCASDCVSGVEGLTAVLAGIASALGSGTTPIADSLEDCKKSATCYATLETDLTVPSNGLVISSRTGPTSEGEA